MADGVRAPRRFVQAPRSPVAVRVGAAFLAGWLLLLGMVLTREGLAEADPAVLDWLVRHRSGGATAVFEAVSSVGVDAVTVALATAWVALVAVRVRSAWPVATLVAAVGAAGLLSILVKSAVHRARPATATMLAAPETGWSFPSGHTVVGTAVAGALVLVVWHSRRSVPVRAGAVCLAVVVAAAVGASRLYLGDHWLTDVLASYLVAGGVLALVAATVRPVSRPAADPGAC